MSRNSGHKLSVMIFGMAVCLTMPACRTITETEYYDASIPVSTRDMLCKLKRITIPEMTFYSPATLVDALDFITKASRDYDLPGIPLDQRGVSYRLRLNSASPEGDRADTDPFAVPTNCAPPKIAAISVREISLYDALQLVCEVTNMRWSIYGGVLEIEPDYFWDTKLVTRSYTVPPVLHDYLQQLPNNTSNQVSASHPEKPWKAFFEQLDMPSPDFSEFNYLSAIGKLRVTGTHKNLAITDALFDQFAPHMVEVEIQIHAFRTTDIEHLRLSGGVSLETLMALRKEGKAKPVASATALTKSGQEATVKAVKEVIYPTELLTNVFQADSNVTVRSAATGLIPSSTTMREMGMILRVVPEIRENSPQVNMSVKPEWITLDRWESYPADLATSWTHPTRSFKQPVFGVTSLESQLVMMDGETLLLGSCSTPDGEWVQVGFLTTRLNPVHPRHIRVQPAKAKPQGVKRDQEVSRDQELFKKMQNIVIPEVMFRPPATLIDAMHFFKEASIKYDQSGVCEMKRGINFVLELPQAYGWVPTGSNTNMDPFVASAATYGVPVIPPTSARSINLYDAMKLMCDVTGMKFRIRDGIVWISPIMDMGELTTRTYYPWLPSIQYLSIEAAREEHERQRQNWTKDYKDYFEELGVPWPVGSSIRFLPELGWLRVTNTHENLEILEQVCKDLSLFPSMVEIDVQIHAFRTEEIEQLRLSGDVSVESLMALRRKGKSKQVASATVLTKSGQEAVVKAVQEVIYPSELLTEADQSETTFVLEKAPQALMSGNFTMQETGMKLQVVPEVSADSSKINATLKASWTHLEEWKAYPADLASGWTHATLPLKQPVFSVTSFETQTMFEAGKTVVLGSSSTPDGKWVHVGFLTVKESR